MLRDHIVIKSFEMSELNATGILCTRYDKKVFSQTLRVMDYNSLLGYVSGVSYFHLLHCLLMHVLYNSFFSSLVCICSLKHLFLNIIWKFYKMSLFWCMISFIFLGNFPCLFVAMTLINKNAT